MTTDIREKLKAILDGLDRLNPPYPDASELYHNVTSLRWALSEHYARCDPDTMREIGQSYERLLQINDELFDALENCIEAHDTGELEQAQIAYERAVNLLNDLAKESGPHNIGLSQYQTSLKAKDAEIARLKEIIEGAGIAMSAMIRQRHNTE